MFYLGNVEKLFDPTELQIYSNASEFVQGKLGENQNLVDNQTVYYIYIIEQT